MLTPALTAWAGWTATGAAWELHHRRCVERVPHRILVWGVRGKSSAVRLLHAGFAAAGKRVVGRITGDQPLLLLPDGTEEVVRRIGPPNIREMRRAARRAARLRSDALCFENMAIQPVLAKLVASHCIKPTCILFTFDGLDHAEVYPTAPEERAAMFAGTFPLGCPVIICDSPRNNLLIETLNGYGYPAIRPASIGPEHLYPHTQSLAGAVMHILENCGGLLSEKVASKVQAEVLQRANELQGIRTAHHNGRRIVDFLSVNDPDSIAELIALLKKREVIKDPISIIYVHRRDRPERLKSFVPMLQQSDSVLTGHAIPHRFLSRNNLRFEADWDKVLSSVSSQALLLTGNINGPGAKLRQNLFDSANIELW